MDTNVYIALSRQLTQFQDMEMTANNIANVNTPGYNAQKMVFDQYLVKSGNDRKDAYANNPSSYRDTANGAFKTTGNPLDLAINGHGYFQVETQLGPRYTKAGNFQITAEGVLVTSMGYPVMAADGSRITLPPGTKTIEINGIGQVIGDGQPLGQIGAFEFENEQKMKRLGNSLFSSEDTPTPSSKARIIQGSLETANVNGVTELVRVMELARNVGNTSKYIETMYDLERKLSTTMSKARPA